MNIEHKQWFIHNELLNKNDRIGLSVYSIGTNHYKKPYLLIDVYNVRTNELNFVKLSKQEALEIGRKMIDMANTMEELDEEIAMLTL